MHHLLKGLRECLTGPSHFALRANPPSDGRLRLLLLLFLLLALTDNRVLLDIAQLGE